MKRTFVTMIFGALLFSEAVAQTISPAGDFFVNLDFARFRNDDQSGYLEIYYGFYPNLLTFEQSGGKHHGGVMLKTRIIDDVSGEAIIEQKLPIQIAEADTSKPWYRYPVVTQAGFAVPYGKYSIEVVAADSLAPARNDSVVSPIEINKYEAALQISDLELCKKIAVSQKKDNLFYKNSLEVVPIPSLVFGIATSPVLFYYAELYNTKPREKYTLKGYIRNANDEVVREISKKQSYQSNTGLLVGNTTITSFPPGKYFFRCVVTDEEGNELVHREKEFNIFNPHLSDRSVAAKTKISKELAAYSLKDLKEEFEFARYVSTDTEIEMFPQLETDSAMRDFLVKFWGEVASGRMGKEPLSRRVYLQRVEEANNTFTAFGRKGWKSDRGRVFILYGNPDEVERFPAESQTKAYRIWRYFSIESGVEFVFVDRNGYNDFELVHSTKRDELSDEMWQRFLQ
ncbi:MAG: GWxTD domain-containing protein [bacterium]